MQALVSQITDSVTTVYAISGTTLAFFLIAVLLLAFFAVRYHNILQFEKSVFLLENEIHQGEKEKLLHENQLLWDKYDQDLQEIEAENRLLQFFFENTEEAFIITENNRFITCNNNALALLEHNEKNRVLAQIRDFRKKTIITPEIKSAAWPQTTGEIPRDSVKIRLAAQNYENRSFQFFILKADKELSPFLSSETIREISQQAGITQKTGIQNSPAPLFNQNPISQIQDYQAVRIREGIHRQGKTPQSSSNKENGLTALSFD